jgi:hypothetical protein
LLLSFRIEHNDFVVGECSMSPGVNGTNPFAGAKVNPSNAIAPISPPDGKAQESRFVHESILCLKMHDSNPTPFHL